MKMQDLPCHFDPVSTTVSPIKVSANPVHSNPVRVIDVRGHNILFLSVVILRDQQRRSDALPGVILKVSPVNSPIHRVVVYCNRVHHRLKGKVPVCEVCCVQRYLKKT